MDSVWFIVFLVLTLKVHHSQQKDTYYVKPHENTTCPGDPCLTLEEYMEHAGIYFDSNVEFVFISGKHNFHWNLRLFNVSNAHFQGENVSANETAQIIFSPLANITFIACKGITIDHLSFVLSGWRKALSSSDLFASIEFKNSSALLSHVVFRGNRSIISGFYSSVLFARFSQIVMNDIEVNGAKSVYGAALVAHNSIVKLSGNNTFNHNLAMQNGGVLFLEETNISFSGSNYFQENVALFYDGGAIVALNTNMIFNGETHFNHNRARKGGGAIAIENSILTLMRGALYFLQNSAYLGGAMSLYNSSALITGEMTVQENRANAGGGIFVRTFSHVIIRSHNALFLNNFAVGGGAISSLGQSKMLLSGVVFKGNLASQLGGALSISLNSHVTIENSTVIGNRVGDKDGIGGAISAGSGSSLCFKGNNHIENNLSIQGGGGMNIYNVSQLNFTGNNTFQNNNGGYYGGGFYVALTNISIEGTLNFINNRGFHGGAIHGVYSHFDFDYFSDVTFDGNKALDKGGAVSNTDTIWNIKGSISFNNNSATLGGAMLLAGVSKVILNKFSVLSYKNNHAAKNGGAIFFSDTMSTSQCQPHDTDVAFCYSPNSTILEECKRINDCFLELDVDVPFNSSTSNVSIDFSNNFASESGSVIFGGTLDNCRLYLGGGFQDGCGNTIGREYTENPLPVFLAISTIIGNMTLDISSEPYRICFCEDGLPNCEINTTVMTMRGKQFTLSASTVGQGNYSVPSSIKADFSDSYAQISQLERVQSTGNTCTDISYRVFSKNSSVTLILFPDGPCRDTGIARREVKITFLPCPDGFVNVGSECLCDERLNAFNTSCNIDKGTISRSRNNFWIMGIYDNSSYQGLLLHQDRCPLDFCVETEVGIDLENSDIQCNHNHSGVICGSCQDNFSLALGTLHCLPCTNSYLFLILPFSLAGIVLVVLLLLLQLTVAHGTMNGLIFYVNVVQVNRGIFFPPGVTNILTVFIAWMNLDLGIETCFYDGLNTYVFVWLQFLFPFYVWFLIGLIIIVSRHSNTVARSLGSNPISVLATLLLLSYSKILRTIISTLSRTSLQYPNGSYQHVWLYDGSVPYFQRADHIILGVFATIALFCLFLPYTFLLLFGTRIQAYSHWKLFSWINKIKPFMDAYYAPYKKKSRYWIGILLLVRCALFLTFAFNALGNATVNLLTITTVTVGLTALAWLQGRLYAKIYNDILEAVFILNLSVFAAATYHVKEIDGSQTILAYSSTGLAFVIFIGIILYHVYLRLQNTPCWKKVSKPDCQHFVMQTVHRKKKDTDHETRNEAMKQMENVTTSVITLDDDDPLLEYN